MFHSGFISCAMAFVTPSKANFLYGNQYLKPYDKVRKEFLPGVVKRVTSNGRRSTQRGNINNSATDVVSRVIDFSKYSHRLLHQEDRAPKQRFNLDSCIFFGHALRITHMRIPGIVDDNIETIILFDSCTDSADNRLFRSHVDFDFEHSRRVVGQVGQRCSVAGCCDEVVAQVVDCLGKGFAQAGRTASDCLISLVLIYASLGYTH